MCLNPCAPRYSRASNSQVRIDGSGKVFTGTVRWVSADASFTPYFALTEHDRSRLSYLAEVDVPDASVVTLGCAARGRFSRKPGKTND